MFEYTRIFASRIFDQNIIFPTSVLPTREYFSAKKFITISVFHVGIFAGKKFDKNITLILSNISGDSRTGIIQLAQMSLIVLFVHYPLMALNTHPDTNLMLTRLISANIMSYDKGRVPKNIGRILAVAKLKKKKKNVFFFF